MSIKTNSRLARFIFLFYIATGIAGMILFDQATGGQDANARLASIAAHTGQMRLSIVFVLINIFNALILAVTLYALTREEDRDLALLALASRIAEGVINAIPAIALLLLLSLAMAASAANVSATNPAADCLFRVQNASITVDATLFAVGSTLFSYLFLQARTIPAWLARLGILSSIWLIFVVPLEGIRLIQGPFAGLIWLSMLVFEVTLGFWLLIKGVNAKASSVAAV